MQGRRLPSALIPGPPQAWKLRSWDRKAYAWGSHPGYSAMAGGAGTCPQRCLPGGKQRTVLSRAPSGLKHHFPSFVPAPPCQPPMSAVGPTSLFLHPGPHTFCPNLKPLACRNPPWPSLSQLCFLKALPPTPRMRTPLSLRILWVRDSQKGCVRVAQSWSPTDKRWSRISWLLR